jgi:hypothetical protein
MPGGSGETTVTSFVRGAMPCQRRARQAEAGAVPQSRADRNAPRCAVPCRACARHFSLCAPGVLSLCIPLSLFFPVIYCTDGNFLATWTSGLCTASNVISVCALALHFSLLPTGCCCSSFCSCWTVGASL